MLCASLLTQKIFGGFAAEKGKRTKSKELRNVPGETKADGAGPVAGVEPEPAR